MTVAFELLVDLNWQLSKYIICQLSKYLLIQLIELLKYLFYLIVPPYLGACVLSYIYKALKTAWPESYTSVQSSLDNHVRENPLRSYIFFRSIPVFLISLFVAVMVDRLGGNVMLSMVFFTIFHLRSTNLRALWDVIKQGNSNWVLLTLYHVASMLVVIVVISLTVYFREYIAWLVPPSKDVLISLWSGIIATVIFAIARGAMATEALEGQALIDSLIKDMRPENWRYVDNVVDSDEQMKRWVRAIILAEVQQRPRWFRRLENIAGRHLGHKGTFGVAQMYSEKWINDQESIELLAKWVQEKFSEWGNENCDKVTNSDSWEYELKRFMKEKALLEHNSDTAHVARIVDIYNELRYSPKYENSVQ